MVTSFSIVGLGCGMSSLISFCTILRGLFGRLLLFTRAFIADVRAKNKEKDSGQRTIGRKVAAAAGERYL
jgi:hypothetical protein